VSCRLGVVGLGVTGSAVAAMAHERGHEVHLLARAGALAQPGTVAHHALEALLGAVQVVVCALPPGGHAWVARQALASGCSVVSVGDAIDDILELRALHTEARERAATVVVGGGFSPGVTCLLAVRAAAALDQVDEVHVAKVGTGGPACARQHHRALGSAGTDWRDGRYQRRGGGSGRELMWFPEPVGGADCYRAALPDALLLQPVFPAATRITARMAATRRDRLTSRLPMLAPPHAEGGMGAVRVELRGRRFGARQVVVAGAAAHPAAAAAAMAVSAAEAVTRRDGVPVGSRSVGELGRTAQLLRTIAELGVTPMAFAGADA
jgi:hypothetical protein